MRVLTRPSAKRSPLPAVRATHRRPRPSHSATLQRVARRFLSRVSLRSDRCQAAQNDIEAAPLVVARPPRVRGRCTTPQGVVVQILAVAPPSVWRNWFAHGLGLVEMRQLSTVPTRLPIPFPAAPGRRSGLPGGARRSDDVQALPFRGLHRWNARRWPLQHRVCHTRHRIERSILWSAPMGNPAHRGLNVAPNPEG